MMVRVDFYKGSGKWYAGGEVDVGEARLWRGDMAAAISLNQKIVYNPEEFYCVVTECEGTKEGEFVKRHFRPGEIVRTNPAER